MKHDLYKILKIRKNASMCVIESAFRRRSMEVHPDRGGDNDEFLLVKLAYDVLSDPERRERYDRTGEYEDANPDNSGTQVVSVLTQVFAAVAHAIQQQNKDPTQINVLEGMRVELNGYIDTCHDQYGGLVQERNFLTKFLGRFTTQRSSNFLEDFVRGQIASIDADMENLNQRRVLHERSLEMLKDFVYKHEAASPTDNSNRRQQMGTLLGMPVYIVGRGGL